MPTVDQMLLRLAQRVDPRTKASQQPFNDMAGAIVISSLSGTTPVVVTTATAHGLRSGNEVYISGNAGTPLINNTLANPTHVVTVTGVGTFTVPVTYSANTGAKGTVVPAMIGAARGNSFEPQQLLDAYNQARWAAFGALRAKYGSDTRTMKRELSELRASATVAFAGATPAVGPKPAGYVDWISLSDGSGTINLVGPDRYEAILAGRPNYTQSSTNRHVTEIGINFVHSSTFVTGNTTLQYFGIADWTLAQVLAGTTLETFNESHLAAILELAEAITQELGGNDLTALATKLLGGK